MARQTLPLSHKEIAQAKAQAKEYNLSDGQGLMLRVKPNGTKTWLFNYYHPVSKKRKNISFGSFPTISLARAREEREQARLLLSKNIDPQEHREEISRASKLECENTLKNVSARWFEIKRQQVTKDYAEDIWRSLNNHVFPNLADVPLNKLSAPLVIEVLKPIAERGNLETVKRLCQRLNEVMVFATNTGLVAHNPIAQINKAFVSPTKKNMATIKPSQLPDLMKSLSVASIKFVTRCLIEWQLHTMTRPSEAAGARWDEIDLERGIWIIPAERMKKRVSHTVPLTPQTLAIVKVLTPISANRDYLFPGDRNPTMPTNSQTANMALKRMGYKGELVAHGLRSLASTILNEQGFDSDIIESALAHIDKNEVRRAYNRSEYIERRRIMMNWWSNHIEQSATGNFSLSSGIKHIQIVNERG
ncbi:integrase domain-containing protein [Alteromonas sp. ASW11-36]|uniref:Integrase domain-containing protein n=1 Tax=Alteromonas arenosi TaxID=3055817 RepID=A0ABT7SWJ6_9ALTE|nr:integrase domain-containing protein [Alteromonas sp. ASW11-36]MDM7860563.1 integrase domain-containing protein [Alteromonas sp. ASW11-36]